MLKLNDLIDRVLDYNPAADLDVIKKAYVFSAKVHDGQTRKSGEAYLSHPMEVAGILTELKTDVSTIATGILHDTVEDTLADLDQVDEIFGKDIAHLVDGVTKIGKISFRTSEQKQAENFRKMLIAMAKDIRVILVKLADRLHNMRTLQYLPAYKQQRIAVETLEIYAPLAHRLGISWIKSELEDLCFKYLKPEIHDKLAGKVKKMKKTRERYMKEVCKITQEKMDEAGFKALVTGRIKHLYSIFRKMEHRSIEFEQVDDLLAFRIVVDSMRECYEALGIIHSMWKPVPGRFKDYVALPKANMYQSLHTTVIGPYGERIEIQIRTNEMHLIAEEGIAAHWGYKMNGGSVSNKDKRRFQTLRDRLLNGLLEWQRDLKDSAEFLDTVKVDLFADEVYIFTPKGEVMSFPQGATPIDFAYAIHTDVGHHCVGARANGRIVPLKYQLHSGDTVEIVTNPSSGPSRDWLKFAKTSRAKAKIRQVIKKEQRERSLLFGKELFEKELKRYKMSLSKLEKDKKFRDYLKKKGFSNINNVFISAGYGKLTPSQVLSEIYPGEQSEEELANETVLQKLFKKVARRQTSPIKVGDLTDIMVNFGKCCNALPGDSIIAFITRGRGATIHRSDCSRVLASDTDRQVDAEWVNKENVVRPTRIQIVCVDEPGLLANISRSIMQEGVNISQAEIKTTSDKKAICNFEIGIKNIDHLHDVIQAMEKINGVISVERK